VSKKAIVSWSFGVIALAVIVFWMIWDRAYRIPVGPELPIQPADRHFSEESIALNNRAMAIELLTKKPEESLRLLDEALKLEPDYYIAYQNKAQLLMEQKQYAEASIYYKKLHILRPRTAEYYVGHAYCLHRTGKKDKAHSHLLKAMSAYKYRLPTSPFHARLNRAFVIFLLDREYVALKKLNILQEQFSDEMSQKMISGLRQSIAKTKGGDHWLVLGFDE